MAAAQEPLPNSQQRSNSAKLGKLIFQEGTVVLRSLFDRYHSPLNLEDALSSKIEILRSLRDSNLVSPGEWMILFPDDGSPPTSQKMEAHLLFVLLQNICGVPKPSGGWDKPPETSDEGNDFPGNLAKLNSLISEVARQTTSGGVENMCFQFYWSQITDVVSTLGSVELPFSFEEVKNQPMDKFDEDKYNRLLVEWTMPNQDVAVHFQETAEKLNSVIQSQDETKLQLMQGSKMPFTWSKSSLIGSGCNGTKVYHGQLTSTGQQVAVKKMYNGVFDKGEAEKLRKCKHQNIIHCFAIYEEEEFFYLALELGEKTLMDCIDENKFDSNGGDLLIEKCFVEVASGVAYLHKNNICHRDIKPGNILLMAKNDEYSFQRFVLADLNCARDVPSGETISTQSTVGTPGWMAPEMCVIGCRRTIKIDIFSLGCVYYYTITKKHPYGGDGETLTECQKNINKKQGPSNFMTHFENYKHLNELLLRMMHADLDKRPSASEVLKYLRFSKEQKGLTLKQNSEQYLQYGFDVGMSTDMAQIQGSVLPAPTIQLEQDPSDKSEHPKHRTVVPRDGSWDMRNNSFYKGSVVEYWALFCYVNRRFDNDIKKFIFDLQKFSKERGVVMKEDPCVKRYLANEKENESAFDSALKENGSIQLFIVIIPDKQSTAVYESSKQAGDVRFGVHTQCVKLSAVHKPLPSLYTNIALKINAKMGGVNHVVNPQKDIAPVFTKPVIMFGADMTHPSPGGTKTPSIAAVVGSLDRYASRYCARIRIQRNHEIMKDLANVVKEILIEFYRYNNGAKPQKIVFYRDGVSEGQFHQVLMHEVSAVQQACVMLEKGYQPGITFVVVQKGLHVRLFPADDKDARGKQGSVPPGTTVDRTITHPIKIDFYLCSHQGTQVTSKAANYRVLYDDNRFTADLLQQLTYHLCHSALYPKSLSLPAPAHYADLAACRARLHLAVLMKQIDRDDESFYERCSEAVTVNEKMMSQMYFI